VGGSNRTPDVISLSYGSCALSEDQASPGYVAVTDGVLGMAALTGVSTFVAAGDSGSTTCSSDLGRTTLSYPAVSPFVTAVGGTRLALGLGNTRVSETVWNDSVYGQSAAGEGVPASSNPAPPTRTVPTASPPAECRTSAPSPTSRPAGPSS
jgi:subtilase family serine protease